MIISHETPLDLLDLSLTFNDYDYILPHYYVKYPKYKEFMLKCKEKGRFSILDNGLFEGGVFPENDLIKIINETKPNIFILPDVWNNAYQTLENMSYWQNNIENKLPSNTNLMVVVQGKSFLDFQEVIHTSLKLGIKHFGFNHSSIAYADIFPNKDPLISKMMGRVVAINRLIEEDIFDKFKNTYIHLLGCALPQELIYHNKQYISSVDTSNPVIVGIKGNKYKQLDINFKPDDKIEKFMEEDLASSLDDIIFNINTFRKWTL